MGSCDIVLEMHHPSRGGSIMTDGTATGWAQARATHTASPRKQCSAVPTTFIFVRSKDGGQSAALRTW